MTQNQIILIFFIELATFYLIFYMIFMANKWVNRKRDEVDELIVDLPEAIKSFRREIRAFNKNITSLDKLRPLTVNEIGNVTGEIVVELLKSRLPFSAGNKFPVIPILFKLWKYKDRIKATFINKSVKI